MTRTGTMLPGGVALTLLLCSCTAPDPATPPPGAVIATQLRSPWSVAFADEVALVSERDTANIVELRPDGSTRSVGRIDGVVAGGEGGLLGIAVHGRDLYAYSTGGNGNRIQRFRLHGDAGALTLGEPETVLADLPASRVHNGGRIAFGPDGMLYVTVGDAGDPDRAQDLDSLSGKILRLTPEGGVPADNPFPGSPVYSLGHRNPQGIAWGPDGTLYASEFGQDTWDELNVIRPGENYGWPIVEGIGEDPRYRDPVQQWSPAQASPSGIAVHDGAIHVANLRGARLRIVPLEDLSRSEERHVGVHGRLRDVVESPAGELWMLTSNTDGRGDPGPDDDIVVRDG